MGGKSIEEKIKDAKGVNIHGHSLRIAFQYQGERFRETLGLPPSNANLNYAINLRASILHDIKIGVFDYADRFPNSKNAVRFNSGSNTKAIRVGELAASYLKMKETDIGIQSVRIYGNSINQCVESIGSERIFSTLTSEDILLARNELLTTRKARTVNSYLVIFRGFLEFAQENGYTDKALSKSAKSFKTVSDDPHPLEIEEFNELIEKGCTSDVDKNLITVAVYTGLRTGELCALAWEDVDFDKKIIYVRRSITDKRQFKLPKTHEFRKVHLMPPAIEALKAQRVHTFMMQQETIDVHQVDKTQTKEEKVRPIFRPGLCRTRKGDTFKPWFTAVTLSNKWRNLMSKTSLEYRVLYQTRHTYACWGLTCHGNAAFIANQMGHKDLSMLVKVYGRWMESSSQEEAEFIWAQLSRKGHNK